MDDRKFDSIVRKKLEDYHHPVIDQGALAALHRHNDALPQTPWYSRHRTELIITSGIALLVILYLLGDTVLTHTAALDKQRNNTINAQKAQIEELKSEVGRFQLLKIDTVRIIEVRTEQSALIGKLMQRIALLEESNQKLMAFEGRSTYQPQTARENLVRFSPLPNFPATSQPIDSAVNNEHEADQNKQSNTSKKSLGAKSIRALEKHYTHGVGIKLGPTADIFGSRYSLGDGHPSLSGGILAEFIVSPSLGLEAGVKYSKRYYAIRDEQILSGSSLPGVDEQFGNLQGAEVDYRMLEVPLNLKYRYPLSLKDHWIASIGYSSLIYLNEEFEYTYEFDNQSPSPASIVSTVRTDELKVYAGTINVSLGMSHQLKNRKIVEASLFYNHGIGTQGIEKTRAQYFGLRGSYWFTVQ